MLFPDYAAEMIARLRAAGHSAYAVGGCVRDSILGRTPNDWDVTTSARPHETQAVFDDPRYRVRTGNGLRHGTVTVFLAGDSAAVCEITTYRSDGSYSDHRRPDAVAFVSDICEDLARRDFTVNAMAAAPAAEGETEILDPFGGRADLAAGILRCVGEPSRRFDEDALRILRGLRFAARYGFTVEEHTAKAMHTQAPLLAFIAPERIGAELTGILSGAFCGAMAEQFADIFASLLPGCTCDGAMQMLTRVPSWPLRLALLCRECTEDTLKETLMHYALGAAVAEKIVRLRLYRDAPLSSHAELCRLADIFGEAELREYFAFRRALATADESLSEAETAAAALFQPGVCYNTATLAADGRALIAAGIPAGPGLGQMLRILTDEVIAGRLPNDRAALIGYAKESIEREGL